MLLERIEAGGLAQYTYVLGHDGDAVVIDPRRDVDEVLSLVRRRDLSLSSIIETHRNEDYIVGSQVLAELTGAQVWHADGGLDYEYGQAVEDGRRWSVGGHELEAIHTPGHTPGHMSYLLRTADGSPWMLFSGDCLFAGDVGRTDLLGEAMLSGLTELLYESLHERVLPLGPQVILLPAHGAGSACGGAIADRSSTTLGLEMAENARLSLGRDEFLERQAVMLERPPYFDAIEPRNLRAEGLTVLPWIPPLGPDDFADAAGEATVLDVRRPPAFLAAHVPGAVSIWPDGLAAWVGWFVRPESPLLLVSDAQDTEPVLRTLLRMGYDNVIGTLQGGMHAWHAGGRDSASLGTVTAPVLRRRLEGGEGLYVLDVRTAEEVEAAPLPDAQHIPLAQLAERLGDVPTDRPVYTFCGSGLRSTVAASLLARSGSDDLTVIFGGMKGFASVG